jgi:hypothetical protein
MYSPDSENRQSSADFPADPVSLTKPLDPTLLLNAINTILSTRVHSVVR